MLGWSFLMEKYYPKPKRVPVPVASESAEASGQPDRDVAAAPSTPGEPAPARKAALLPAKPGQEIVIETGSVRARLTTAGGGLVSWQLKDYLACGTTMFEDIVPLRAQVASRRLGYEGPLSVRLSDFPESGTRAVRANLKRLNVSSDAIVQRVGGEMVVMPRSAGDVQYGELELTQDLPQGRTLKRILRVPSSGHEVGIVIELTGPAPEYLDLVWTPGIGFAPPEEEATGRQPTFWNVSSASVLTRQDLIRVKEGKRTATREGANPFWASVQNKYFAVVLVPSAPEDMRGVQSVLGVIGNEGLLETGGFFMSPKTKKADTLFGILRFRLELGATRVRIPLRAYLGPQDYPVLKRMGSRMEKVVDYGFFGVIALPMVQVLKILASVVRNYGIAIILLTLLVKAIFWWPTQWGMKQMRGMQTLQPKTQFIKEQFKDDPRRQQEETMRLYREAGVNPAAGCLPMLLQIPIFFALYSVLRTSIELRGAPFAFWIHDLSMKDPYYVLPLLVGVTMYLQQVMTPTMGDPAQAKMMRWFSLAFVFMFFSFPSGFMLYFLVQNVTQIAQQWYVNRKPAPALKMGA